MGFLSSIKLQSLILLPLLSFVLYDRYPILKTFYYNHPSRLQSVNAPKPSDLLFENEVRNCEDAELVQEEGFAFLSCDPGRDTWNTVMGTFIDSKRVGSLYMYSYASGDKLQKLRLTNLPDFLSSEFHPLGITYHAPSHTLFVVDHNSAGHAIHSFSITREISEAYYLSSFNHSLLRAPNSMTTLSATELLVTNDHYFRAIQNPLLSQAETYLGLPGGSVNYVDLATGTVKLLGRLPFANGIARIGPTTVAVASCSKVGVYVYEWNSWAKTLTQTSKVPLPFIPDNLSVDGSGKLLIAGHPYAPSVEEITHNNHKWELDGPKSEKELEGRPRAPSWAAEWDQAKGETKDLVVGMGYDASTTAVRDVEREVLIVVGLYARGVLVKRGKAAFGNGR